MKKTQIKDALRNIKAQRVPFFSIIVVAALAVTAYLGINFASKALYAQADRFYNTLSFRDFEVTSTLLMSGGDVAALREVDGVADAEGVFMSAAKAKSDFGIQNVYAVSLTSRINKTLVTEGRLPENVNECALETDLMDALSVKVGDKIRLENKQGGAPDYMLYKDFTVVGRVLHADHYAHMTSAPGERYALVLPEAFDAAALDGCFMRAEIAMEKPQGTSYFSKAYKTAASAVYAALEKVCAERESLRDAFVHATYEAELSRAFAELENGGAELESARGELEKYEAEIKAAEEKAALGLSELEAAKAQIDAGERELKKVRKTLANAALQLKNGREQLESGRSRLADGFAQAEQTYSFARDLLKSAVAGYIDSDLADALPWAEPRAEFDLEDPSLSATDFYVANGIVIDLSHSPDELLRAAVSGIVAGTAFEEDFEDIIALIESADEFVQIQNLYDGLMSDALLWNAAHAEYLAAEAKYEDALEEYEDGRGQYRAALEEFESAKAQYEAGIAEYEAGLLQIEEGKAALATGREKYENGVAQYNDAVARLTSEKTRLESLSPCRFVLLDASGNGSFVSAVLTADNISKLGMTFALLFVLVGALVLYATVSRIIGEHKKLVGTGKALGLYNREVFAKYLIFGVLSTLTGMLTGVLLGFVIVQSIITVSHSVYYVFGTIRLTFDLPLTLAVLALGVLLATAAVWVASRALLRQTAKELMQESMPQTKNKPSKRAAKGSLYARLIFRNMKNDLKRVIVTVVSIAGCCSLLVIGFTMNANVQGAIEEQFGSIEIYESRVAFDPDVSADAENEVEAALESAGAEYVKIFSGYRMLAADGGLTAAEVFCADDFSGFIDLKDFRSGKPVDLLQGGIVIQSKTAQSYNFAKGDTLTLYDGDMNPHKADVFAVVENYFGRRIYMSFDAYREIFGESAPVNTFLVKGAENADALVSGIDGVESVTFAKTLKKNYQDLAAVLKLLTVVLAAVAGMMAYFVLLNLINMYVSHKKRELTVMRVNGFTTKEVINYVARESVVTTALGTCLGLAAGSFFAYLFLTFLEQPSSGFLHGINLPSLAISAAMTVLYAAIINAIALRKVKNLSLRDIA